MADLRLRGAPLALARALVGLGPVRSALWSIGKADFDLDALSALPPSARWPLDADNRPVQGRAPHTWEDAALGTPPTPSGRHSVSDFAEAFRTGRATPRTVLDRLLDAVDAGAFGHATFSPFVHLDRDRALADADAATARYALDQPLGPLDGVPVPVKDEVHVHGLPTLGGTAYRTEPASDDAWVVQQLKDAGAVVPGTTACTEWGMNPFGANMHRTMPRNAHHPDHGAGGSSSGSGVAVALGMAPVALGSDGGGSIRIPAALNGVYGLKPTWIRIGRTGDDWAPGTMPHLGPLGITVADLVAFLSVTAGIDPSDPATLHAPDGHQVAHTWTRALGRGVRGARIGIDPRLWAQASPAVQARCEAALEPLWADGAVRVEVSLPITAHAPAVGALTIASETAANLSDDLAAHREAFGHELLLILEMMRGPRAQDLLLAARTRAAMRRELAAVFRDQIDLLAMPTTATPAPRYPRTEDRQDVLWTSATAAMTALAFPANLSGLPAGTAPAGMVDGLPVGLQLVGDAWDEASVIAGLAHLQRTDDARVPVPKGAVDLLGDR